MTVSDYLSLVAPVQERHLEGRSSADLARVDLAHADLARVDLAHADLAHADLAEADLAEADLAEADQLIRDLGALIDAGLVVVEEHVFGPARYAAPRPQLDEAA